MSLHSDPLIYRTTIRAAVILIIAFFCFSGAMIYIGKTEDLQRVLILMGNLFTGLINLYVFHKVGQRNISKTEETRKDVEELKNGVLETNIKKAIKEVVKEVRS